MTTTPDPMTLWKQAGGGTKDYDPQRYRDLMHEHGLLLRPGDEGYGDAPRSAPCGWPRARSTEANTAQPVSPDAGEAQGRTEPLSASLPPCPTPCDDDCELGPDGCHESHQMPWKRGHQPWACEDIQRAIGATVAAERERVAQLLDRKRAVFCRPCDGEVCDYSDELAPASELVRGGGDEA